MFHNLIQFLLEKSGRSYKLEHRLPISYLVRVVLQRGVWLARGFLRSGRKIFLASGVILIHSGNIIFGRNCTIEPHVFINAVGAGKFRFGDNSKIGAYSRICGTGSLAQLGGGFVLGDNSACGEFCFFGCAGGIHIGRNVLMGQYVSFHAQEHSFADLRKPINQQGTHEKGISIGDDCWIGAKATILDGAMIGRHCVIAAGAVVKGTFPDYSMIGGVPARLIRSLDDA